MRKIYVDECGYTGEHLLDAEQPFQAASSIEISELEAEELIKKHFPRYQAPELKHQKMCKRPTHWNGLLGIQRELLLNYPCHSYVMHKKFMLIQKFFGNCLEPFLYANGVDFFQDGALEQTSSMFYFCAPALLGKENFNQLLTQYQKAARTKDKVEISRLVAIAKRLSKIEFSELLGPLGAGIPEALEELSEPKVNLDLAYPLVIGLLTLFENREGQYQVIHDESENMKQYTNEFEKIASITDKKSFKISSICNFSFPLKFTEVIQVDSKMSSAAQLADILVGGAVEMVKAKMAPQGEGSRYAEELSNIYDEAPVDSFIYQFPSKELTDIQERQKGNQSNEFIKFAMRRFNR